MALLGNCRHCGMSWANCLAKMDATDITAPDDETDEERARRYIRNECCANCSHIA